MRLDKYLADMRLGSRKDVKELIKKGHITINDQCVKKSDIHLKEDDIVKCDGRVIEYVEYEYYILYKPAGYVTATEDRIHPVVMELIESKRKDLFPVGRLDKDTEGVLLITNDGKFSHHILAPKNHVMKTYYVEVANPLAKDAKELFLKPMEFEEFTSSPAIFDRIDDYRSTLTIHEGKYHQVKRMYERIGSPVTYLKRIAFGPVTLDGLNKGDYRPLKEEELAILKEGMHD